MPVRLSQLVAAMRCALALAALSLSCLAAPVRAAGTVERWTYDSPTLGEPAEIIVRRPEGHDPQAALPVVLVLNGGLHFHERNGLARLLDAQMPERLPPALVVAMPGPSAEQLPGYGRYLREELWPELHRRYPGTAKTPMRGLMAFSSGANDALAVALREPDLFERVALQSPGWMAWDSAAERISEDATAETVAAVGRLTPARYPSIWFIWGAADEDWEARARANGVQVMSALAAKGVPVHAGGSVPGGHGLPLLRDTMAPALRWLLQAK